MLQLSCNSLARRIGPALLLCLISVSFIIMNCNVVLVMSGLAWSSTSELKLDNFNEIFVCILRYRQ